MLYYLINGILFLVLSYIVVTFVTRTVLLYSSLIILSRNNNSSYDMIFRKWDSTNHKIFDDDTYFNKIFKGATFKTTNEKYNYILTTVSHKQHIFTKTKFIYPVDGVGNVLTRMTVYNVVFMLITMILLLLFYAIICTIASFFVEIVPWLSHTITSIQGFVTIISIMCGLWSVIFMWYTVKKKHQSKGFIFTKNLLNMY